LCPSRFSSAAVGLRIWFGAVIAAWAQSGLATTNQLTAAAPDSVPGFDRTISEIKKPVDWFSWGSDLRVRNEYFDNIITLTDKAPLHEQDVIRIRGRVWASLFPVDDVSLNVRLSAEPRDFLNPAFASSYKGQTGMEWRYGIVDILNVKWTNVLSAPLTITAGRQDILFGDYWNWWLVADGTPADGSWTFFLDSIRLNYDAEPLKTKFDMVYIHQNARPDDPMPTIGYSSDMYLTEQNEQGVILNASNKSIQNTQIDGYFIYKGDSRVLANGDNADIYTMGGRITATPWQHWQYSVEGGYQVGQKQDPTLRDSFGSNLWRDISAFGGNGHLTYLFKDPLNNQVQIVGEYLSGDDPSTKKDEMFDVLWGRWPRFSEGYIYSYIYETGGKVAQLNNIGRIGAGWSMDPIKGMTLSAVYNAWFAPESVPTRALNPHLFSDTGNFRGHYLQTVLKHKFNKHVSAHLWGEFIWAGDYYQQPTFMDFLRAEVLFTF
jgi:hypothetical protein